MTLTQITYFNAVCEYQNVTKAANALYVSRTAVSRALKDLENEWGLVLFTRSRTGVELTEDGKRVREIFTDFNDAYMALKKSINNRQRSQKPPELRIGITTTTGSKFFPDFFREFLTQYPNVRLRFQEYTVLDSISALLGGELDFFITPHIFNERNYTDMLEKIPTYTSELMFCVGPDHPLSDRASVTIKETEQYEQASLLIPLPSESLTEEDLRQQNFEDENNYFLRCSQQQLIHKVVLHNFASIVLPREVAESWTDIRMIPFDPPRLFPVYVIWNKEVQAVESHLAFQKFVRNYQFE